MALRALSYCAALHAAGVPLFLSVFEKSLEQSRQPLVVLARRSAWVGLALVVSYELAEPARLVGAARGVLDLSLQRELVESPLGTTTIVRALGLLMIGLSFRRSARSGSSAALIGASFVAVSFAFMGHTTDYDHRWISVAALLIHSLVVAFWFGSLTALYRVSRVEPVVINGMLIERFSRLAGVVVPMIFIAGTALALVLVSSWSVFATSYGKLLIAKVVGFSILMSLAATNKFRLGPRIGKGEVATLQTFRLVLVVEWALIAIVIAITSTMTGLFSPGHTL